MTDAERFLTTLHPALELGEYLELRGIDADSGLVRQAWFTSFTPLLRTAAEWSPRRTHCYVSVQPRAGKHGGDLNVARIVAVTADIDAKLWEGIIVSAQENYMGILSEAITGQVPEENGNFVNFANFAKGGQGFALQAAFRAVWDFPLRPSMAVCSGGGIQPYWLLDRPLANTEQARTSYRLLSDSLARAVCGPECSPDLIGNVERPARLVGSLNWKYDPARSVELLWCTTARYTPEQLTSWLQAHAAWSLPVEPPAVPYQPRPAQGSVIDDFNARYDLAALLVRHGARELRQGRRCRYFAKEGQRTVSATLDHYPGTLILQAQTFLGLSKDRQHGYDAFAVFTALEHGGDGKAAYAAARDAGYGPVEDRYGLRIMRGTGRTAHGHLTGRHSPWAS